MNENKIAILNQRIDDYARAEGFSGVIRVTHKDQILYERSVGYADVAEKREFSANSRFTLYSLSKPFCALGLMKLWDKGLIDLSAHPSVYVPEVAGLHESLTVHHLLTHTSGIPDFFKTSAFYKNHKEEKNPDLRALLPELCACPAFFLPGESAHYQNTNFILSALIIENVSGMAYADYMREEVFLPLGMTTAVVEPPTGLDLPERVTGYEKAEDGTLYPAKRNVFFMLGGGDIVGRVDDVYCLNHAIKHKLLVSEEAWERILTPAPQNHKGYGCTLTTWHGKRRITHNGGFIGFRTLHVQLPEDDFDIILLSNTGFGDARKVISEYIHDCFYGDSSAPTQDVEMDTGYI